MLEDKVKLYLNHWRPALFLPFWVIFFIQTIHGIFVTPYLDFIIPWKVNKLKARVKAWVKALWCNWERFPMMSIRSEQMFGYGYDKWRCSFKEKLFKSLGSCARQLLTPLPWVHCISSFLEISPGTSQSTSLALKMKGFRRQRINSRK